MSDNPEKILHINHCVDVEGPMTETLEATWERLEEEDGLKLKSSPTKENLKLIQQQKLEEIPLEKREYLSKKYGEDILCYMENWNDLDQEILKCINKEYRHKLCDSFGSPYAFSWYIYDHYGFTNNPRYHAEGRGEIFRHYEKLLDGKMFNDGIYWHYHHVPASGDALEWNTNWFGQNFYEDILASRIIEHEWFSSTFRAGGHIERNDLSWWLEMFMPIDFSCRTPLDEDPQSKPGAVCDWRHSIKKWGSYNPDWYDYRKEGNMKRHIFRCLDIGTWLNRIQLEDVMQAFEQANNGERAILAYYNHDFRRMDYDVEYVYELIKIASQKFPEVKFKFDNSLSSAKWALGHDKKQTTAPKFTTELNGSFLKVKSDQDIFGPQPFLAIKENGRYFRDNLTDEGNNTWCYTFRKIKDVEAFGIAASNPFGDVGVSREVLKD